MKKKENNTKPIKKINKSAKPVNPKNF